MNTTKHYERILINSLFLKSLLNSRQNPQDNENNGYKRCDKAVTNDACNSLFETPVT